MKKIIVLMFLLAFFIPFQTQAGECCGCDPIYERNLKAEYNISAYVRNEPCTQNSTILATGQKGWVVKVVAETDGWYKVTLPDGTTGWTGSALMTITDKSLTSTSSTNSSTSTTKTSIVKPNLSPYLGYIFLAVEKNGEAYYYHPEKKVGFYLGRPADAFKIMREQSLGATHEFIHGRTYFPDHVVGKILLDVQTNGEAYYIYPKDRKKYYLGRPDDAFKIMRELGLGISNADLESLPKQ